MTVVSHIRLCFLALTIVASNRGVADTVGVVDIPRLADIVVDGDAADWAGRGLSAGLLMPVTGELRNETDHNAEVKLGWNESGLLLLIRVRDNTWAESDEPDPLWMGDAIDLFMINGEGKLARRMQWIIAPGVDGKHESLRVVQHDNHTNQDVENKLTHCAFKRYADGQGYVLETILPWSAVGVTPEFGTEVRFQIYVYDRDEEDARWGVAYRVAWYPKLETHIHPENSYRLRLAELSGTFAPVRLTARCDMDFYELELNAIAPGEMAGRKVTFFLDDHPPQTLPLTASGQERAVASTRIRLPPYDRKIGRITCRMEGTDPVAMDSEWPEMATATALQKADIAAKEAVFPGEEFPAINFVNPLLSRALIGDYTLRITFYNEAYQPVTKAITPGRYGAVAEILPSRGKPFRRFVSLYRTPGQINWYRCGSWKARMDVPEATGLPRGAGDRDAHATAEFIGWQIERGNHCDSGMAIWLAGMRQSRDAGLAPEFYNSPEILNRQWWLGLKGKLYGWEGSWKETFCAPVQVKGVPAPVVHEGSAEDAGVLPEASDKIDAVLKAWAADSDQPFVVCVVRHGVIVLHRAYGTMDGRPMTVGDMCWMASITKLISGFGFMMLVDQGKVSLDDRVERFLPPLKDAPVNKPLLVRNLFNHTCGLFDHWGAEYGDMEERIAAVLPKISIGTRYNYNGTGLNLGGKIVESLTGEVWPLYVKKHLLGPLGCENTDIPDCGGGTVSTALDMARIGQMLLNKGAYGSLRFMSKKTFEQMLPRKIVEVLGPDSDLYYGVGCSRFSEKGLGEGTFGHGAASGATLRIDPVHDLVIVMVRNAHGSNYDRYHQRFIDSVVKGLAR